MRRDTVAHEAEAYIRWPKLRVWHAARVDGHTVCGLPYDGDKVILGWATPATWAVAEGKCKSCERMKDADTVQRPRGEV